MDTAKVFPNGRSQAVRLPKEYRIDADEVYVKKIGEVVLLVPKDAGWRVMESAADYFTKGFMKERNQPGEQKREDFE